MLSALWNKLLRTLGAQDSGETTASPYALSRSRLRQLIDEVVEGTDPRIRALPKYGRSLTPAIQRAYGYLAELVEQMPPSVPVDNESWSRDPLVHALFSSTEDLQRVFSKSRVLQKFFERHLGGTLDHCYLQLGMAMREKTVLGMQLQGERVRRDVRQTTVNFLDYRIPLVAETEEELRETLVMRAFRLLVSYALEQITDRRNRISLLEQQCHLLNARVRSAKSRAEGLQGLLAEEENQNVQVEALERELAESQRALQQAKTGFATLEDYVRCIDEVLGQPQAHVRITPRSLFLNRMNVKLEDGEAEGAREVRLTEVSLGDEIRRVVVLARFPRELLLERSHFLREAERYYS
jgi:hypothetical protein